MPFKLSEDQGPKAPKGFKAIEVPHPDEPGISYDDAGAAGAKQENDLTIGGWEPPDPIKSALQPFHDMGLGVLRFLNGVGSGGKPIPGGLTGVEKLQRGFAEVGADFNDEPKDIVTAIKKKLTEQGHPDPSIVDTFMTSMGENLGYNALLTASIMAAGAGGASLPMAEGAFGAKTIGGKVLQEGKNLAAVGKNALRGAGDEMIAAPGATAVGEALSTAGQTADQNAGGSGMVGAAAGAGAAGIGVSALKSMGKGALGGGVTGLATGLLTGSPLEGAVMGAATGGGTGLAKGALLDGAASHVMPVMPGRALTQPDPQLGLVQDAAEGVKREADRMLRAAVAPLRSGQDSTQAAGNLRDILRTKVWPKAQKLEDNAWITVNKTRLVSTEPIRQDIAQMTENTSIDMRPDWLPQRYITMLENLPAKVPMDRLLAIRTGILQESRGQVMPGTNALASPNDTLKGNLDTLSSNILDRIGEQYPNDAPLAAAREVSKYLHDKFDRGPLAPLVQRMVDDASLKDAGKVMSTQSGHERFGKDLADVASRMDVPEVERAAKDWVNAKFSEKAGEMDGLNGSPDPRAIRKGQQWLNAPAQQRMIREFPAMMTETAVINKKLSEELIHTDAVNNSEFIMRAQKQVEPAIQELFATRKMQDAEKLKALIGDNEPAMQALKDGIIFYVMKAGGAVPQNMQAILASNETRQMMSTLMGSGNFARFNRMINEAVVADTPSYLGRKVKSVSSLFGRVMGGKAGRASVGGLQGTNIGATLGKGIAETWTQGIPPSKLLANAIYDPKWERLLAQKVPENLQEANTHVKLLRGLIGVKNAAAAKVNSDDAE